MNGYSLKPATIGDLQDVFSIIVNQNIVDYGEAMMTLDDLQKSWRDLNLETFTCNAYLDGALAGYAELLEGDSPYIYLAERNNVALASRLLTFLEDAAAAHGTNKLFTRISEKNRALLDLFASRGYKTNLSFLIMELKMDQPPTSPQWVSGTTARTFIPNQDEQAAYHADEEASRDKGYHSPLDYADWVRRMNMDSERFDPGLWFLACDGDEIVGVALNVYDRETNTGWIDHLGVRRAWRRKGLGKALLLHTFGEFYKRGIEKIKLSVDSKSLTNAPGLYESVGMKTIQQYHIYKKELR